jgi:hypothetical protein
MIGDKQGSEDRTFEAVADTLKELQQICRLHRQQPERLDGAGDGRPRLHVPGIGPRQARTRPCWASKPEGTLRAKKRYLLGQNLPATDKAWHGNTAETAGTLPVKAGSLDFWVPKGAMRFHFAGGARFVHGSAMPQEVIVPLITVRENETDKAKTRQVGISVLGFVEQGGHQHAALRVHPDRGGVRTRAAAGRWPSPSAMVTRW